MADITPYKIAVPDAQIARLKQKLALTDLPDELEDSAWELGSPLADIKRLTAYWASGFSWRDAEAKLNLLPQYTTDIAVEGFGTLKVHFVHQTSDVPGAVPLLFSHGWPGSFFEVSKVLPELVKGGDAFPAFDVVAPSLVNFGFSEGVSKRGFYLKHHAMVVHSLMQKLGYKEYVTQGGDWGKGVTRSLAKLYPESCKANHLNMLNPSAPDPEKHPQLAAKAAETPLTEYDRRGLERSRWFVEEGRGYGIEQGTKPQTIGYLLADSPAGLLAWIHEKLHDWTDAYPWTDDEILTWVSLYAFSAAGPAASARIYYETTHGEGKAWSGALDRWIDGVALGFARFPKELHVKPASWIEACGPVVFMSQYDRGGHFAAWERPDAIVSDLRKMFGKGGGAHGVVEGRSGYA